MYIRSEGSAFKPYMKSIFPTQQDLSHQTSLSFVINSDCVQNNNKYFDFSRKDSYLNNDAALYENPFNSEVLACGTEAQIESPMESSQVAQSHEASVCSSS
jgi:hypothetical protein